MCVITEHCADGVGVVVAVMVANEVNVLSVCVRVWHARGQINKTVCVSYVCGWVACTRTNTQTPK